MNNKDENTKSGIGFVGMLTIAFIVLKLTHVITWSWWWVLSPIWISAVLWIAIVIAVAWFTNKF